MVLLINTRTTDEKQWATLKTWTILKSRSPNSMSLRTCSMTQQWISIHWRGATKTSRPRSSVIDSWCRPTSEEKMRGQTTRILERIIFRAKTPKCTKNQWLKARKMWKTIWINILKEYRCSWMASYWDKWMCQVIIQHQARVSLR